MTASSASVLSSSSALFYKNLPLLSAQGDMVDVPLHHAVPGDWYVVVADIIGSTKAIAAGKYKAVNMLSASVITAALNAVRRETGAAENDFIPYVFGGDGATLLVPPDLLLAVAQALQGTRGMAQAEQGLDMRAGAVRVAELAAQGAGVSVAKSRVSAGLAQAVLSGAGIGLAEKLVKDADKGAAYDIAALFSAEDLAKNPPDFSGLSCRWEPLQNRKGLNLSLIVLASGAGGAATETYRMVLARLGDICGLPESWRPLSDDNMRMSLSAQNLLPEAAMNTAGRPLRDKIKFYARIWCQTLVGKVSVACGIRFGSFEGRSYKQSVMRHTDYIKFDNALRLVMDISRDQKSALENMLEDMRQKGLVFYGMHVADAALMTCLVFDYGQEHFHFVDGADGGYALAAVQLKAQMKEQPETPEKRAGAA